MKFYTDIEAVLGVWDGQKIININKEIDTDDQAMIELLKKAGLRHDEEKKPPEPKGGKGK
jgi:hypothetical protein